MENLSNIFCFVLYDDPWFYDLNSVLTGLEHDLSDFYCVRHTHLMSGVPCYPHYHCLGRMPHPIPKSYFVKKYGIPEYLIDIPIFYDTFRKYMDDGVFNGA